MTALTETDGPGRSYALLADGTTMTIRPAGPGDFEAVKGLHETMSPDNLYFRFFSASQASAEREARRVCLDGVPGLAALLGLLGDELVGVASYEATSDGAAAEIALAVADDMHRRGIATLLLEHLVSLARVRGVKTFVAEVLPGNYPVLRVLSDAGLAVRRRYDDVGDLSMPVPINAALGEASAYLDAVGGRDPYADVASLEPLLAPRSAAVVGSGRSASIGRTILLNIRAMVEFRRATDADTAVEAAAGFGGHVAIKADVPGLLHKTAAGAVELDLHGADEVRAAMNRLLGTFAGRMNGALVEPMIPGGIETIVGVVQEPVFGPVVVFGLGGVATEALGDHAARLAPLTSADADDLIRSIRAAPALLGNGGQPAADLGALRDTPCPRPIRFSRGCPATRDWRPPMPHGC